MKWIWSLTFLIFLTGCANISPLSPNLNNRINNQDGKIDDIKNNQNGIMLDLLKLKNEQQIIARDIHNFQQGLINQSNENTGIQIFQGDGGLIAGVGIIAILIIVTLYYRNQAVRGKQSAEILAQQIVLYDDTNLNNEVFLAALNTPVEEDIYHLMVDNQLGAHNRK